MPKRESILNEEIRHQIHGLLNREYRLAPPSRIILNLDNNNNDTGRGSRSVRVVDQNSQPRVRISSEGPPQSYTRNLSPSGGSQWRNIPIQNAPGGGQYPARFLVNSSTQTNESTSGGLNATETETLSFTKMNERERQENLSEMLTRDEYNQRYRFSQHHYPTDPCLDYQLYFR